MAKHSPEQFVQDYLPIAQVVGAKTGVAPATLLGQWGLETGWGKSVIPGTNNLGNIKDFSGRGPRATDNQTGANDAYLSFDTPDKFGDHFTGLLGRKYQPALNSGEDPQKFFAALKRGGYAEDAGYVQKGVQATNRVAGILGSPKVPSSYLAQSDAEFVQNPAPVVAAPAPIVQAAAPVAPVVQAQAPAEPVQPAAVPDQWQEYLRAQASRNAVQPQDLAYGGPKPYVPPEVVRPDFMATLAALGQNTSPAFRPFGGIRGRA